MLIAVLFFGSKTRGMVGWFRFGSIGFQPGELCKIAVIIALAREFSRRTEGKNEGIRTFGDIWPILWRFAIPFVLICLQPDFGTAIVYLCVLIGMMFMAKTCFKVMATILGSGLAAIPLVWLLFDDYQKNRILVFLDPTKDPEGAGFNVLRAKIVGSSGGLWGKGFFSQDLLTQQSNYLPEKHTDFLFSTISESIGFFGCVFVLLLYMLLLFRMLQLSMKAKDDFGAYLIIGITFMLLFHIVENVGMNIGVMPVTGIPLPLMSSGGSNLVTTLISIGLVLNVNMRRSHRASSL
jgi:rod shape determining protein RodA